MALKMTKGAATEQVEKSEAGSANAVVTHTSETVVDVPKTMAPAPRDPFAEVSVSAGLTIPIAPYTTTRITVGLTLPAASEAIDDAYDYALGWVNTRLTALAEQAREQANSNASAA